MTGWPANDDMIAITRAREERARHETESYREARYQLSVLGCNSVEITRVLAAAKAQAEVMTTLHYGKVRVEYRLGVYTVTP